MPYNWNSQNPWAARMPLSANQLEIERNIRLIKEMKQRQDEADAARAAAVPIPPPVPRGVTPTREQAVAGIARSLRGLPIYEDAPAEVSSAPAASANMNTPATVTSQNQGFGSSGWQGWKTFAQSQAEAAMQTAQQPGARPSQFGDLVDRTTGIDYSQYATPTQNPNLQSNPPATQLAGSPSPIDAKHNQVIDWMRANPGMRPSIETISTVQFPMWTREQVNAIGPIAKALGIEEGVDRIAVTQFTNALNDQVPPTWRQRVLDLAATQFPWSLIAAAQALPVMLQTQQLGAGFSPENQTSASDKYVHTVANIQGFRSGSLGNIGADALASGYEIKDLFWDQDPIYMIRGDLSANRFGRVSARIYPEADARALGNPLLPRRSE